MNVRLALPLLPSKFWEYASHRRSVRVKAGKQMGIAQQDLAYVVPSSKI